MFLIFSFYHGNTSAFLGRNCWATWVTQKMGLQITQRLLLEKNGPKLPDLKENSFEEESYKVVRFRHGVIHIH
jgi:hypothetical protein